MAAQQELEPVVIPKSSTDHETKRKQYNRFKLYAAPQLEAGGSLDGLWSRYYYRWDPDPQTHFSTAIDMGDRDFVSLLLDKGGCRYKWKELRTAIKKRDKDLTLALLQRWKCLDIGDIPAAESTWAELFRMALQNTEREVACLLLDCYQNQQEFLPHSLVLRQEFHRAVNLQAEIEIVSKLLDTGVEVNSPDPRFNLDCTCTALNAAVTSRHKELVSLLLARGADVNMLDCERNTALSLAIAFPDVLELLLLNGSIDMTSVGFHHKLTKTTILHMAVACGNKETTSLLLARGADVNFLDPNGDTALHLAVRMQVIKLSNNQVNLDPEVIPTLLEPRAGADVNLLNRKGDTALYLAVRFGMVKTVTLLLERGAKVNLHDSRGDPLLHRAIAKGRKDIVLELLKGGADVRTRNHFYANALHYAVSSNHRDLEIVTLLLDYLPAIDINLVDGSGENALQRAITFGTRKEIVSLLLKRGGNVDGLQIQQGPSSKDYHKTTPLWRAVEKGDKDLVLRLLHYGANPNFLNGTLHDQKGTPLLKAIEMGHRGIVSLLLDNGANVNNHTPDYTKRPATPLLEAIKGQNKDMVMLLLSRGADPDHNWVPKSAKVRFPLHYAAEMRNVDIVRLLLDAGATIDAVDSSGPFNETETALNCAVRKGEKENVSLLLAAGADVRRLQIPDGAGGRQNDHITANELGLLTKDVEILALLLEGLEHVTVAEHPVRKLPIETDFQAAMPSPQAPYPQRYIKPQATSAQSLSTSISAALQKPYTAIENIKFQTGGNLTPEQADIPCRMFKEESLIESLLDLVGIHPILAKLHHSSWIKSDIHHFLSNDFDFGMAYALARVGWRIFNGVTFDVRAQRRLWVEELKKLRETRASAIYKDRTGQEIIKSPYSIIPLRVWDLKSNRVVDYPMLEAEFKARSRMSHEAPKYSFWAVSHSWTDNMRAIYTPINQHQWPVPLPSGIMLEDTVRSELLRLGAEYVWLDVICLRQQSDRCEDAELNELRQTEWKIDVPTIGNIYLVADRVVRYFNGLGVPFSTEGWDNDRHWLRRAWTLQEIKTENTTFNGAVSNLDGAVLLNIQGRVGGWSKVRLRRLLGPVLRLAAKVETPGGCGVYELVREMAKRCSSKPIDKLTGLFYLLRTIELPTYDEHCSVENAWEKSFHVLPLAKKIEILFDFPYRGYRLTDQDEWFPTWKQMMEWPERDPDYEHTPSSSVKPDSSDLTRSDILRPLYHHPSWDHNIRWWDSKLSLFLPMVWVLCGGTIHETSDSNEYVVQAGGRIFGFYCPYKHQKPIGITKGAKVTLATIRPDQTCNWVVCEENGIREEWEERPGSRREMCKFPVLRKIGVLRTDSSSEIFFVGKDNSDRILIQMDVLFV